MTDELGASAAGIGALAEPVRRALYRFVVAQADAVGREQAADGVGVALHVAKFHLDKLVDEGLLDVEFRRLSGRTGPGAGRPSKLYRRAARELAVSLPPRRYDLVGAILAEGVDRSVRDSVPVDAAVREAARDQGRESGSVQAGSVRSGADGEPAGPEVRAATEALAADGYEPRLCDTEVQLVNCPFDALAREHTALVCGLNEEYVGGLLEGLGCTGWRAALEPEPGLCCVRLRPREPR